MIADRIRSIQAVSGGGGGGATDPYYAYRSLILNFDGNFNDSSPNALAVTDYGDAQIVGDGTFGTVGSFDGSGDKLEIQSNSLFAFGTGDFTIEGWMNCSVFQTGSIYTTAEPTDQQGIWIGTVANGKIHYLAGSGSWSFAAFSNATLNTNTWYHIALIRSGSVFSLYINGVFDSSQTASVNLTNSNNLISVGGRSNFNQFFNGLLGPLRISPWAAYTSNFTPSQDLFPAAQGFPAYDPRNALILNMDGTPGSQTFVDSSPNALAVTAYGNAQIVSDATFGTVASFDGLSDTNLTIPATSLFNFGTGDFTIESWFNIPSGASGNPYGKILLSNENNSWSAGAFSFYLIASSTQFRPTFWVNEFSSSGPILIPSTGDYRDGAWHHIAVVRNGSAFAMYIDGLQVASGTHAGNCGSATRNLMIGDNLANNGGDRNLLALIGPTRITKGVARYTTSFTPPTGPFLVS